MIDRLPKSTKSNHIKLLLNEALDILAAIGIPLQGMSARGLERMAVCFLAVAGVSNSWKEAKDGANLKSRDIIKFVNKHFEEKISSGSYDDIRREGLKLPVVAGIVINSGVGKGSATNDPTRGYALHPDVTSCYYLSNG